MEYSIQQQLKHRGVGGSGMSAEAIKATKLKNDTTEPLHSGYMRSGFPEKKKNR